MSTTEEPATSDTRTPTLTSIEVCGGRYIDLLDPSPADIHLTDIAISLGREGRYSGFCTQFYSVAQHSLLVRDILRQDEAPEEVQRAGLWHDAAEAYLGDVAAPLKRAMRVISPYGASPYDALEKHMQATIRRKFGVAWDARIAAKVRNADLAAFRIERHQLMASQGRNWDSRDFAVPLLDWPKLEPLEPVEASAAWLALAF